MTGNRAAAAAIPAEEWQRRMERAFAQAGLETQAVQRQRWAAYLARLAQWNARRRLLGDSEPQQWIERHLIESLWLAREMAISGRALLDLGSGGGFPGLALAIGYAPVYTTLVELNQTKAAFLRQEIAAQQLPGVVIEQDARKLKASKADVVTVRALEQIADLPRWAGNYLNPDGLMAAWVNRELYDAWAAEYYQWKWLHFINLPSAERRGIGLAQMV